MRLGSLPPINTWRRTLPNYGRLPHILLKDERDRGKHTRIIIWHDLEKSRHPSDVNVPHASSTRRAAPCGSDSHRQSGRNRDHPSLLSDSPEPPVLNSKMAEGGRPEGFVDSQAIMGAPRTRRLEVLRSQTFGLQLVDHRALGQDWRVEARV